MPLKTLVIDTDAGVDDAVAIAMASKLGKEYLFELKLLMTCHGNTSEDNVYTNCNKTLHGCDRKDVIVARGALKPAIASLIDASYFHGKDGLGDICHTAIKYTTTAVTDERLPPSSISDENCTITGLTNLTLNKLTSAQYELLKLLSFEGASSSGITLVTLGPLTNLASIIDIAAHAHTSDSEIITHLLSHINHLVIMGGSANGLGNVTRTAEFNIHADAEAAQMVFSYNKWDTNKCQITVVSWDVCKDAAVPWSCFDDLTRNADADIGAPPVTDNNGVSNGYYDTCRTKGLTHLGTYLRSICYLPFYLHREPLEPLVHSELMLTSSSTSGENKRGNKGAVICDCLAVAVALASSSSSNGIIQQYCNVHIDVECDGALTRGQTVVDFGHCYDGVNRSRNIQWVTSIDEDAYIAMFRKLFD